MSDEVSGNRSVWRMEAEKRFAPIEIFTNEKRKRGASINKKIISSLSTFLSFWFVHSNLHQLGY